MSSLVDAIIALPPWMVLSLVFLLPALEAALFVGLVVPGETAVLIGGAVAHGTELSLWMVILCAIGGATLGDQVGYLVGRRYGPALLARVPERARRGGELDRALDLVRRRGGLAVLLGRWTASLRALVPGIAGMSGMGQIPFTVANIVGGASWASTVAALGYLAGASYRALERKLGLGSELLVVAVILAMGVWLWRVRRGRTHRQGAV